MTKDKFWYNAIKEAGPVEERSSVPCPFLSRKEFDINQQNSQIKGEQTLALQLQKKPKKIPGDLLPSVAKGSQSLEAGGAV